MDTRTRTHVQFDPGMLIAHLFECYNALSLILPGVPLGYCWASSCATVGRGLLGVGWEFAVRVGRVGGVGWVAYVLVSNFFFRKRACR